MKTHDNTALLAEQLAAALRDLQHDAGSPLEVAALAGLLSRSQQDSPALAEAIEWRDGESSSVLDDALSTLPADEAVELLTALTEDSTPEEKTDALFHIDELCAAAWWADAPTCMASAAQVSARLIRTFPEIWSELSPLATRILSAAAPASGDPALALWRAVEATRWASAPEPDSRVPAAEGARRKLGLRLVLSRGAVARDTRARAASGLPAAPKVEEVAAGKDWELVLTEESSQPIFRLSSSDVGLVFVVTRDGTEVSLSSGDAPGRWSCEAVAGAYRWKIDSETIECVIES